MKRLIAGAVCGVSLFGFTAVAGAAGNPPNPSTRAIAVVGPGACETVLSNNPNVNGTVNFPANPTGIFDGDLVGAAFHC